MLETQLNHVKNYLSYNYKQNVVAKYITEEKRHHKSKFVYFWDVVTNLISKYSTYWDSLMYFHILSNCF